VTGRGKENSELSAAAWDAVLLLILDAALAGETAGGRIGGELF